MESPDPPETLLTEPPLEEPPELLPEVLPPEPEPEVLTELPLMPLEAPLPEEPH